MDETYVAMDHTSKEDKVSTIELDTSTLREHLDDVAEYVNDLPNEKLKQFIRNAFYFTLDPAGWTGNSARTVFKAEARYLDLLPALRTGDLSFDNLCDILAGKIGVRFESGHV